MKKGFSFKKGKSTKTSIHFLFQSFQLIHQQRCITGISKNICCTVHQRITMKCMRFVQDC